MNDIWKLGNGQVLVLMDEGEWEEQQELSRRLEEIRGIVAAPIRKNTPRKTTRRPKPVRQERAKPTPPASKAETGMKKCEKCHMPYQPTGNAQKFCPACKEQMMADRLEAIKAAQKRIDEKEQ